MKIFIIGLSHSIAPFPCHCWQYKPRVTKFGHLVVLMILPLFKNASFLSKMNFYSRYRESFPYISLWSPFSTNDISHLETFCGNTNLMYVEPHCAHVGLIVSLKSSMFIFMSFIPVVSQFNVVHGKKSIKKSNGRLPQR